MESGERDGEGESRWQIEPDRVGLKGRKNHGPRSGIIAISIRQLESGYTTSHR